MNTVFQLVLSNKHYLKDTIGCIMSLLNATQPVVEVSHIIFYILNILKHVGKGITTIKTDVCFYLVFILQVLLFINDYIFLRVR